jgi:hypothetical protein
LIPFSVAGGLISVLQSQLMQPDSNQKVSGKIGPIHWSADFKVFRQLRYLPDSGLIKPPDFLAIQ